MDHHERLIDGVFEGGGVKGLAHIGALEELESRGYWFKRVAGASAGAWIAALIACGYRASPKGDCSLRVIMTLDHKVFHDGWLQLPRNLITHGGLFAGRRLTDTLDSLLKKGLGRNAEGPSPTFADLKDIEIHIVARCLTRQEIVIFNRETTPDLSIAEAVRMSGSLPFFYVPHQWVPSGFYRDTLKMNETQLVIDGGVISTFPMFIFKEQHPYVPSKPRRTDCAQQLVLCWSRRKPLTFHLERSRNVLNALSLSEVGREDLLEQF
jgi:NTE family protein